MMKSICWCLFFAFFTLSVQAQSTFGVPYVRDMKWDSASNISLILNNGTRFDAKIEDIQHARSLSADTSSNDFVYYPVMFASDFVSKINEQQSFESSQPIVPDTSKVPKMVTLWGTMHTTLGGGWVHFINCMLFALETRNLSLTAPIMVRPEWKPEKPTPTWKRTRKWAYYVPVNQRHAHNEYKLKEKELQLNNLQAVPSDFITLFNKTSNREYDKMVKKYKIKEQARIDLIKLLLGANYLGHPQIMYIKNGVQTAISKYSQSQLPTIIIFDDLGAAVVMSLNQSGYKVEKMVLRNASIMSDTEREAKELKIEIMIATINKANQKIFEERLSKFYR